MDGSYSSTKLQYGEMGNRYPGSSTVTDNIIEKAFQQGEILRMHILRPTWHFIIAEDIHWMLKLLAQRIRSANESFGKTRNNRKAIHKSNRLIEKHLTGNNHLTKQETETF